MSTTMKTALIVVLALGSAQAQFTDLQPGRNFPTSDLLNNGGRTESVDFGDVDLDGDLDIVLANGAEFLQLNRIYINEGGLQGGVEGRFVDETATRFAGLTISSSRDLDFGDIDGDGDLDLVEANRGAATQGSVQRIHVNQGGLQGGTAGFFVEATDTAWGQLVNVPASQQVFGGNQGPFRDWSCDCDFADVDDDGDLDLFLASYGPNINGTKPSRLFLNDGSGVFDEHWPWASAGADINWHTLDVEFVDLDGDFDLDLIASSRDSQARVFVNNTHAPLSGATTMFTDTTQTSLIAQGATLTGTSNYDTEFADLDGDDDFEIWMTEYKNFQEQILSLTSATPGAAPTFTMSQAILGNPNQMDSEHDFLDFDGDNDLDAINAPFTSNWMIAVNGAAQGVPGPLHRAAGGAASLYPFPEEPDSGAGSVLDVDTGDLDGDGDDDVAASTEDFSNSIWFNARGVPDTHAPRFAAVTEPSTLPTSGVAVLHAAIRDNHSVSIVAFHDVDLVVSIDGGPEQRIDMTHSGSMIFRAALDLGAGVSSLAYRVEAVDGAGNVGISDTFVVGGDWTDLGGGLAGVDGVPSLVGAGGLGSGANGSLAITNTAPSATSLLVLSQPTAGVPFKGGTLLAVPFDLAIPLTTSPAGTLALPYTVPGGAPSGFAFHLQLLVADSAAIQGVALSNGLRGDVP